VFGKQAVISTGDKVVFTLPRVVAQPPYFEIGVNCLDTIVCPTTCDTVGSTTEIPPQHHGREGQERAPVCDESKGYLETCRGLKLVQVAFHGPLVSFPDLCFSTDS